MHVGQSVKVQRLGMRAKGEVAGGSLLSDLVVDIQPEEFLVPRGDARELDLHAGFADVPFIKPVSVKDDGIGCNGPPLHGDMNGEAGVRGMVSMCGYTYRLREARTQAPDLGPLVPVRRKGDDRDISGARLLLDACQQVKVAYSRKIQPSDDESRGFGSDHIEGILGMGSRTDAVFEPLQSLAWNARRWASSSTTIRRHLSLFGAFPWLAFMPVAIVLSTFTE